MEEFDQLNQRLKHSDEYDVEWEVSLVFNYNVQKLIHKYEAIISSCKRKPKHEVVFTHTREVFNSLVREFLLSMPKLCENCGAASPTIVRDGFLKLFEAPVKNKSKQFTAANTKMQSVLDSVTMAEVSVKERNDD